jgi:hypothetical protein
MAQPTEIEIPLQDLEALQNLSNLLHLFNHRNKNQHRRSIWWRHLSTFRRSVNEFVNDFQSLNEVPTSHVERTRKVTKDQTTRTRVSQRNVFWRDVQVPKWHNAFSQIVADGRFAVLGVVLLAVLSQTCQVMDITADYDELGQSEVERVIEDFGREYWKDDSQPGAGPPVNEDLGEVIAREEPAAGEASLASPATSNVGETERRRRPATSTSVVSQRKRKKRNSIDDLVSGLD